MLAGGRGVRVGGENKGLLRYRGRPLAAQVAERLSGSCQLVIISANRYLSRYAPLADIVVSDGDLRYLGPLAGIRAALRAVPARWMLVCPCDAPEIDPELWPRLLRALLLGAADVAVVHDGERLQPLLMALRGRLAADVDRYLGSGGRSVHGWLETRRTVTVRVHGRVGNRNVKQGSFHRVARGRA